MRTFFLILVFVFGAFENSAAASDIACNEKPRGDYSQIEASESESFDPPPGDGPTPIDIGFHLISLSDIDVISGRFRFEGYAEFRWCDPRLAFDEESEGRSTHVFFSADAMKARSRMWIPDISIADSIGSADNKAQRVEVRSDGTVRITGFFSSIVAARFDLRRFPFDKQSLLISMESFTFNRDVVKLRTIDNIVGF